MDTVVNKITLIVALIVIAGLLFGVVGCSYSTIIQKRCINAGYPEYTTTIDFHGYCISWIDATKVVVPVGEIK